MKEISSHHREELWAIIVDGLSDEFPNESLISLTKHHLEIYGFNVTVVSGDNLTIDCYRDILSRGYDVLIFRIHGGFYAEGGEVLVGLFSNEVFDPNKYVDEQSRGFVAIGRPYVNPEKEVFAITTDFVRTYGNFRNSIVMVFSCYSMVSDSMARAFVDRGASIYIGWKGAVNPDLNDFALDRLIYYLFVENLTISNAISRTMIDYMIKHKTEIPLLYYPEEASKYTVWELIKK